MVVVEVVVVEVEVVGEVGAGGGDNILESTLEHRSLDNHHHMG